MTIPPTTEAPIDRIAPTRRPPGRVVMRQNWSHLLFLHWEVPLAALRPLIPAALEIDTFEGRAFVGLVPFTMTGVRPVWSPPLPGFSNFHEVNVRTYVHFEGRDPGVWFFSLDAANGLAAWLARRLWLLPYHHARMDLRVAPDSAQSPAGRIEYQSDRLGETAAACRIAYSPAGTPATSAPGSLEHFLAERYIQYCRRGSRVFSGHVHHPPYPLQPATIRELDESLIAANGIERPTGPPLAHYALGVRVGVFALKPVAPVGMIEVDSRKREEDGS